MARLDLDFHAANRRSGGLAWVWLLLGGLALFWVVSQWLNLRDSEAELMRAINQMSQRPPPVRPIVPADSAAKAARERVAEQLAASWQAPFEALASIRSNKVALISLDANQAKRQVKLVAEARQLADVIEYVETLQQQPGIKRAVLTQHEFRVDDEQQPVRFHITVEWRA